MEDEKHESKRNCHPRQKWLPVAAILLLVLLIAGFSVRYISFVSQTIYQESTSHLEEVLHKSNNMLKEMVRKNLTYLHLYNDFWKTLPMKPKFRRISRKRSSRPDLSAFTSYLRRQLYDGDRGDRLPWLTDKSGRKALQGEDIVMNTALPGKPQMLLSSVPKRRAATGLCLRCHCHRLLQ